MLSTTQSVTEPTEVTLKKVEEIEKKMTKKLLFNIHFLRSISIDSNSFINWILEYDIKSNLFPSITYINFIFSHEFINYEYISCGIFDFPRHRSDNLI